MIHKINIHWVKNIMDITIQEPLNKSTKTSTKTSKITMISFMPTRIKFSIRNILNVNLNKFRIIYYKL